MRGVVVGVVCARGRIGFVTVADAQGRARRCFDVFPTWGGCRGDWRAPLLFVACFARRA